MSERQRPPSQHMSRSVLQLRLLQVGLLPSNLLRRQVQQAQVPVTLQHTCPHTQLPLEAKRCGATTSHNIVMEPADFCKLNASTVQLHIRLFYAPLVLVSGATFTQLVITSRDACGDTMSMPRINRVCAGYMTVLYSWIKSYRGQQPTSRYAGTAISSARALSCSS